MVNAGESEHGLSSVASGLDFDLVRGEVCFGAMLVASTVFFVVVDLFYAYVLTTTRCVFQRFWSCHSCCFVQ